MAPIRMLPLLLATLSALTWTASAAAYREQRYQCPQLSTENCTADNGLAFFDGCTTVACIGWRSAVREPTYCRPAVTAAELSRCRQLNNRLEIIQSRAQGAALPDVLVNCPQFSGVDICSTADQFFTFNDGCNVHLCDGSGGTFERSRNQCPEARTPEQLFFCKVTFNSVVRAHASRHACRAQAENAERICEVTWPGYQFSDACYGGNHFVCGPGKNLLTRPPTGQCPLESASESIKCREVAAEVAELLAPDRGYTCPELHRSSVCTAENSGFVYNDGCNLVLCEGPSAGLSEGRTCKLPLKESNPAGSEFCRRRAAEVRRELAAGRRHNGPCVTAAEACPGPAAEGVSYFDGCNYCTCLGAARSQCTRRKCLGFFGTDAEFSAYCATVARRLD
ncbi:hypothetical protein BOX15_Mlig009177g1 [Macrostomum lignano]|uniref:Chitin-binding type-2 domain-containing protein n=2 Tax=Macrostomum lignano TaxID=282301 RepID=A0A1I8GZT9_9PLAT|nr:hypothetical protein BOX15_Mlig009177g2 [Macrostomum lignano]PAA69627.1 hypothetical protein BOX15_Mlig009177g1 [Macrostomum lignano]